jgi:hypothetical protein
MGRTRRIRLRKKFTKSEETVATRLDFTEEIVTLLKDLQVKSPLFHKGPVGPAQFTVQLQDEKIQFRGLASTSKSVILPGTTLLLLPEKLLITSKDLDLGDNEESAVTLHDRFAFFLCRELQMGETSKFYKYISTLPSNFDEHPVYLVEEDVNLLPKIYQNIVRKQSEAIQKAYLRFKERFPGLKLEDFKYSWLAVNTRSVFYEPSEGQREMALAPFLDLFNHSPNPNTQTSFDNCSRSYVIQAVQAIKPFEQIFISYGNHSNHKLWSEYGFIPFEYNPHSYIPIELEFLKEEHSWLQKVIGDSRKVKIVEQYKLESELSFLEHEPSPNLCLLIQLSIWNPELKRNFDFHVDYDFPEFRNIVRNILESEIRNYVESLRSLERVKPCSLALGITIEFLKDSITFLKKLC